MGINVHKTAAFVAEAVLLTAMATGSSMASTSRNPSGLLQASGASLELDGNSTLHHYSAKAQGISVNIGVDGGRVAPGPSPPTVEALIRGHSIKTLELTVPVDKLSSGEQGARRQHAQGAQERSVSRDSLPCRFVRRSAAVDGRRRSWWFSTAV